MAKISDLSVHVNVDCLYCKYLHSYGGVLLFDHDRNGCKGIDAYSVPCLYVKREIYIVKKNVVDKSIHPTN